MSLTIFAHLGSGETDEVVVRLVRAGLWDHSGMIHDSDSGVLVTTTDRAKTVALEVMAELDLSPRGATVFHPAVS